MYSAFNYRVKKGVINSISPGVFFYYVTVKGSDLPVTVLETNTLLWNPMLQQQVSLYNADCNKLASTYSVVSNPTYSVTVNATGWIQMLTISLAIMWSHQNLKGTPVTTPYPNQHVLLGSSIQDPWLASTLCRRVELVHSTNLPFFQFFNGPELNI